MLLLHHTGKTELILGIKIYKKDFSIANHIPDSVSILKKYNFKFPNLNECEYYENFKKVAMRAGLT